MKLLIILFFGIVSCFASDDQFCYDKVKVACSTGAVGSDLRACNAKYGAIDKVVPDLQKYAKKHILDSFDYLLLSSYFGNYEKNRPGFEKLYKRLSDEAWSDSIELMKHIAQRGGAMDLNVVEVKPKRVYESSEVESLAAVLDMQKEIANKAFDIHQRVSRSVENVHDAEIAHYLEHEFMPRQSKTIRELSGYSNDMKNLLLESPSDSSLSVFIFDEYLQKV